MKNRLRLLPLPLLIACLCCSCATTSVKKTWTSPDSLPPKKVAVLALSDDGFVRRAFEGYFAEELSKAGVPAITCFNLLTLAETKQDKAAAVERFRAGGADGLLILHLVNQTTSYRHVQAGPERYAATITDFHTMDWYNYYDVAFVNMTTGYGSMKQTVYLESSLYDFNKQKPVWSALTKTVLGDDTDRLAEVKAIAGKVIAAMREDRILSRP